MTTIERDYVLGTHDEEVERLGLQHQVWRARTLDAWRSAGFTRGQTILDVGCGPGWAAMDLAGIVGRNGRVIAFDRSQRFLDVLRERRDTANARQIEIVELDLDGGALPDANADGAWLRWVLAFVRDPRALLSKVARALRPGGTVVIHEYFDYATWRVVPRSEAFESFVSTVMRSWRDAGGEPDIGLSLPGWLNDLGFDVRLSPIVELFRPGDFGWQWPDAFVRVGASRLVDLGYMDRGDAERVLADVESAERERGFFIAPSVLEVIATKP